MTTVKTDAVFTFPLAIHWPDYTDEQRCYIRQDVADELYEALEEIWALITPSLLAAVDAGYPNERHMAAKDKADAALARARGDAPSSKGLMDG